MLHRRIYQFLIVYILGLILLLAMKYVLSLSDYVIPGVSEI
ncbi:MAG: ABC transporter permease, partial [Deltaproteobacteria bacterium]|nr:ABC transporter permease [Deltaproteobacteria bacterium]